MLSVGITPDNKRVQMRRAFTLIELLVVVAVVGLLIGILVPALGSARAQAKRAACSTNLRQIGTGLQVYMAGNHDRFPYVSFMPSVSPFPRAHGAGRAPG